MKKLNFIYYGMMGLVLLVLAVLAPLAAKGLLPILDPLSRWGQIIQYVVIFDALICIPAGLYGAKREMTRLSAIEDEGARLMGYTHCAAVRIVMVSHVMVPALAAFYFLGGYQSMMWLAAIGAVAWYFTKPTEAKRDVELRPHKEGEETY